MAKCQQVLSELIVSYRDDFAKYRRRVPQSRIDAVFRSVAAQGLGKFVYNRVDAEANAAQVKTALDTLILAGLLCPVTHTAANGVPLGAETNEKCRRMLFCDTGLLQRVMGLDLAPLFASDDLLCYPLYAIRNIRQLSAESC